MVWKGELLHKNFLLPANALILKGLDNCCWKTTEKQPGLHQVKLAANHVEAAGGDVCGTPALNPRIPECG